MPISISILHILKNR